MHLVVNALMAIGTSAADRPDLAVLPLGTDNDYARTLAVPLHAGQALALIGRGIRRVMEVIRVECAEEAPCFAINLCSGGFTADMREALTDERKDRWGALAYLMAGAETLPNRTTYRVQLAYDDGPSEA
ncbi:MAG: diacylglycerol kinase family lipid kinase, partial [Rhodothermaceae bacterium]|nr:diacylglycerol kinase family lipid kinase [Rhodothermaceae bacterium]